MISCLIGIVMDINIIPRYIILFFGLVYVLMNDDDGCVGFRVQELGFRA